MAQRYFPVRQSSVSSASPSQAEVVAEQQFNVEEIQEAYVGHKDRLLDGLKQSRGILESLKAFNGSEWVMRYPQFKEDTKLEMPDGDAPKRKPGTRRSMSFADDPETLTEVTMSSSNTLVPVTEFTTEEPEDGNSAVHTSLFPPKSEFDFSVLRLDLKLGPHGSSTSPMALVSQLEKSSIANLLDGRISSSLTHIDKLKLRVEDTSSKVLVTGDLNAGKSTLVNALLRRGVMPVDQQPCTSAFCEVHDVAENEGVEEVHILKEGVPYSVSDENSYTRASISELEDIISENDNARQIIKLYLADPRPATDSFLNNGIADISLIDAPGLNRDSLKTTALFTRQEEIDVIVFVVSAENHFTLSARDFLQNASNEKAYVFIVVNKYEQIRDKAKCRRLVMEQIKELSPRTYEDAADLVHFVDSSNVLGSDGENEAFGSLESALRSFVLVKRSKSKLHPAATYLSHLLSDVELLAGSNVIAATSDRASAISDLDRVVPVLTQMQECRDALEDDLVHCEEGHANEACKRTKARLSSALERVERGELSVERPRVPMPSYPGLFGVWGYAANVRKAFLASLDQSVKDVEDETRVLTAEGVGIVRDIGAKYLPADALHSKRKFMPQAMFTRRRTLASARVSRAGIPGGVYGLGIGLAQRTDLLETTFLDIFDAPHQFHVYFGEKHEDSSDDSLSVLSVMSVGLGAITLVGGKAIGARSLIEGAIRVSDLISNESARRWLAPVLGAVTLGMSAYFILELPNSIPRTVGRRVRAELERVDPAHPEEPTFVEAQMQRIGHETRKVLRIASWDVKSHYRTAVDEREKSVKAARESKERAEKAIEYFSGVAKKSTDVREEIGAVVIS